MMFVDYERLEQGDYQFPIWSEYIGWMITLSCILWIPGMAVYIWHTSEKSFSELLLPAPGFDSRTNASNKLNATAPSHGKQQHHLFFCG